MSNVSLFLAGDVMTGRGIDQILPHPVPPRIYEELVHSALEYVDLAETAHGTIPRSVPYDYVWGDALSVLDRFRPDVRLINLETSVTLRESAAPKGINYRMSPRNIGVLRPPRIDCCVLANNHVIDWGTAGLLDTIEALGDAGIRVSGAGHDERAARQPAVIAAPNGSACVLVFAMASDDCGVPESWAAGSESPGVHRLPDLSRRSVDAIAALVAAHKRPGDLAIASIHWGANWGYAVPARHRRFAHALIDEAGIDAVHGHSSHHPKAIEVHQERPIFYGCGDLLNDYEGIGGYAEFRGDLGLMYFPTFELPSGRLLRLHFVPMQVRNFRLRHPTPAGRESIRATIAGECGRFGLTIRDDEDGWVLEW